MMTPPDLTEVIAIVLMLIDETHSATFRLMRLTTRTLVTEVNDKVHNKDTTHHANDIDEVIHN